MHVLLGVFRFPSPPNFELALIYVILLIERNPNLFLEIFYLSYSQRAWGSKICARPNRIGEKSSTFCCFYWLIGCALACWFQKCIHVHSKYCSKWVKIAKNLRELAISGNCKFPEVFRIFYQLAIIFAMDMYIFLESARQGAADELIKNPKSWHFFPDPIRARANLWTPCALWIW